MLRLNYASGNTNWVERKYISIPIKFYVIFVDYQHLQKYFNNWNITLNYCFIFKSNVRGSVIWKCSWQHQVPIFPYHCSPTLKNGNRLKSIVPTVPMVMSFKFFKYFSSGRISVFVFASLC